MARVPKTRAKALSSRSRAARRATSPSIDVDKSLKDTKAQSDPLGSASYGSQSYSGITKKSKAKPLSRQQRLRREKGAEKHEQNIDKHQKKVADSRLRGKRMNHRRAAWDDLNDGLIQKPAKMLPAALAENVEDETNAAAPDQAQVIEDLAAEVEIESTDGAVEPLSGSGPDVEVDEIL